MVLDVLESFRFEKAYIENDLAFDLLRQYICAVLSSGSLGTKAFANSRSSLMTGGEHDKRKIQLRQYH